MQKIKLTPEQEAIYRAMSCDMDAYARGIAEGMRQSKQFILQAILQQKQPAAPKPEDKPEQEG
jgi:hypothetical protein